MKEGYDVTSFFKFLGYGRGNQTYNCPDLKTVVAYCRGSRAQLEELLAPTPFELADDRFAVSVADFSNNSTVTYFDAAVILSVKFGDAIGGTYYFEYEDRHSSVAGGRELWGYPKKFAKVAHDIGPTGAHSRVSSEGDLIFDLNVVFDESADGSGWEGLSLYPHLQVRAVPQLNGPSFQHFDIISRDTSKDYVPKERRYGKATIDFGSTISIGGTSLKIVDNLGAVYLVGDYFSTAENGVPTIVASLV